MLCSRLEYHTQRYLNHAVLSDRSDASTLHEGDKQLEKLKEISKATIQKFSKFIEQLDLSDVTRELHDFLEDPGTCSKLLTWSESDVPDEVSSLTQLEEMAKKKVETRIRGVIQSWEDENHVIENVRMNVAATVRKLLREVGVEVSSISSTLTSVRPVEIEPSMSLVDITAFGKGFFPHNVSSFQVGSMVATVKQTQRPQPQAVRQLHGRYV